MKNSTYIEKRWMQFKVSALSASITVLIVSSIPTQISASDIDIYQSGGTGAINIYFMLDTSGSMGSMSLAEDYKHTSSIQTNMCKWEQEEGRNYTQKSSGGSNIRWATFEKVANNAGQYKKDGNNYTFVGSGNGDYNRIKQDDSSYSGGTRYERSNNFNVEVKSCANTDKICHGENDYGVEKLNNPLQVGGYTYAMEGEKYCLVKESSLSQNNNDKKYLEKIKTICEPSTNNGEYRCLTRLANLKKGLLSLINSNGVDDTKYFAVGQYSGDSSSNLTDPVFLAMNKTNKDIVSKKIVLFNSGRFYPNW